MIVLKGGHIKGKIKLWTIFVHETQNYQFKKNKGIIWM